MPGKRWNALEDRSSSGRLILPISILAPARSRPPPQNIERSRTVSYTRLPSGAGAGVALPAFARRLNWKNPGPTTGSATLPRLSENRVIRGKKAAALEIAPAGPCVYKPALSKVAPHGYPEHRH